MKHSQFILKHNAYEEKLANTYSIKMQKNPSSLELRMIEFLNRHNIYFESQKILYIKDNEGKILKFFIADFFIPASNIIIETDGKFHEKEQEYDILRDGLIKDQFPDVQIIRWKFQDFNDAAKLQNLFKLLVSNNSCSSKSYIFSDNNYIEPFFFTYSKQILALYGKNVFNVTTKVLYKLLEFADNNTGKVYMNSDRVQEIMDICQISRRSYYRAIEELKEDGIISGDKCTFTIAENMFWKGDRKTREKLMKARLKVTFDPIYDEDDKTVTVMQSNEDNSLRLTR